MSPADNFTMSPGTSSRIGISLACPSRTTVAVTVIIAFNFAAALSARVSWTKRSDMPRITINIMTVPAREIACGVRESRQHRQQNHQRIASRGVEPVKPAFILFVGDLIWPEASNRSAASSSLKPFGDVLRRRRISATSFVAESWTNSAVRSPLGSFTTACMVDQTAAYRLSTANRERRWRRPSD